MAFDFGGALKRANVAIGRLLQPGWVGNYIPDAIKELSHPDLAMLPLGETRDAYENIFVAVKATDLSALTEGQAEEISTRIWAFRARCELECREARKQHMEQVVEEKPAAIEVPTAPVVAPIEHWDSMLISTHVPVELHYRIKNFCLAQGITMKSFIKAALVAKLEVDEIRASTSP